MDGKRGGVAVEKDGFLKRIFCGFNPIGDFADFCCRGAEIKIPSDDDTSECTTYCWCCCFWRGFAVGAVFGFLVGVLI